MATVEAVTETLDLAPFCRHSHDPIIGNVAEYLVAVQTARQNKMDSICPLHLASAADPPFVIPLLVFASLLLGSPLALQFNLLGLISMAAASMILVLVSLDGEICDIEIHNSADLRQPKKKIF